MVINILKPPEYKLLGDRSLRARHRESVIQQRTMRGIERRVVPRLRRIIQEDVRRAAEAFIEDGEGILPLTLKGHAANLESLLVPVWRTTARRFGNRILAAVQKARWDLEVKDAGDTFRKRVEDWVVTYGGEKIVNISNTTMNQVRSAIQQGESEGMNVRETAKLIVQTTGGTIAKMRSRVIARTEVHQAAVAGGDFAAEELNDDLDLDLVREWLAAEDLRTRPSHARADGQRRDMETPFDIGGYKLQRPGDPNAPAHETIQCRCVVGYVTPEDRDDEQIIEPFQTIEGGLGNVDKPDVQRLKPVDKFDAAETTKDADKFSQDVLGLLNPKWRKTDLHIANYANETMLDLKNRGLNMPRRIMADSKIFTEMNKGKNDTQTTSFYSPEDDTIYLNPRSVFFRDKGKFIDKAYNAMKGKGWTTGQSKRDVLTHELAHREHVQRVGDKEFRNLSGWDTESTWNAAKGQIREKVSRYAATNPKEFVAEVYTKVINGGEVDPAMMKWYKTFGGPLVKESFLDGGVVLAPTVPKIPSTVKPAPKPKAIIAPVPKDRLKIVGRIHELNEQEFENFTTVKQGKKVSFDEKDAIADYQMEGSDEVNNLLRKHGGIPKIKLPIGDPIFGSSKSDVKIIKHAQAIDRALAKTEMDGNLQVYRGINKTNKILGIKNIKNAVGKTLTDDGFMSTSVGRKEAENFAGRDDDSALIKIVIPKGHKAISMSELGMKPSNEDFGMGDPDDDDEDDFLAAMYESEQEVLLPRRTALKITRVEKNPNKHGPKNVMYAEIVEHPDDVKAALPPKLKVEKPKDILKITGPVKKIPKVKDVKKVTTVKKKSLTNDELSAVNEYQQEGYEEINRVLRENSGLPPKDSTDFVDMEVTKFSKDIDTAMVKAKMPVNLEVYRGLSYAEDMFKVNDLNKAVGKVFVDEGFTSTTTDSFTAKSFIMDEENGSIVRMVIPKGHSALNMTQLGANWIQYEHEREFLLPRGTAYRIVKVKKSKDKETPNEIFVEIVPRPLAIGSVKSFIKPYSRERQKKKFVWWPTQMRTFDEDGIED
tara:strand:+ start:5862 stop:9002 length:3141 start_codon:yes stop_codon:yes gene_type:complete